ncbi:hypothetical protein [Lysobacter enzymogenes]|uniref:hypothetical protein n=1 Tax=Lysobacter enzymogenes TaxID=69 RepID=UPI001A962D17|nr:hypothetical protein [Lysobacter enzymogenes]QQP94354.1 hypothetical protein JHW38_13840 [Lysobacter enzymogenes]
MDENLDCLLHDELEGLFAPPGETGAGRRGAVRRAAAWPALGSASAARPTPGSAPASAASATPHSDVARLLARRLHDPKVFAALARLLETR